MNPYRPHKIDHHQTVLYEIDMLRYCADKLRTVSLAPLEAWLYLEGFLLHFRNLIEFFGSPHPSGDDLSIRKPERIWNTSSIPPKAKLELITRQDLWEKYEPKGPGQARISNYLHHCTEKRLDTKEWPVSEMWNDIVPVLSAFEELVDPARPWKSFSKDASHTVAVMDPFSASTASVGRTMPDMPFRTPIK